MSQSYAFPSALADVSFADDRVRQFEGSEMPLEIQALGEPEQIYRPNPLFSSLLRGRYILAALLPAGLAGLYWILFDDLQRKGQLGQLWDPLVLGVFGAIFLGTVVGSMFLAQMPVTRATVYFYRRAAVVAEGNQLTLIPWKHLLFVRDRISTPEGQQFYCGWLEGHDRFEEQIWEQSAEHWAPAAVARINAGETVTVGDLGVSATHISYKGKTAAWEEVSSLILVVGRLYQMNITTKGSFLPWAWVNMHEIPNARAMQQVITSICPQHLLAAAK